MESTLRCSGVTAQHLKVGIKRRENQTCFPNFFSKKMYCIIHVLRITLLARSLPPIFTSAVVYLWEIVNQPYKLKHVGLPLSHITTDRIQSHKQTLLFFFPFSRGFGLNLLSNIHSFIHDTIFGYKYILKYQPKHMKDLLWRSCFQ